ncbi:hypothetical protein NQ176_g4443 [Zarea fungicola]|uniref:Uncharacterized protein n=1 Tax=Zarea fungicola TaxID=93591 RepID=A0ACC1NE29_9HYPO|nr:hypothetical protein NQ176_g4443 [Lecanicillium fungicola]
MFSTFITGPGTYDDSAMVQVERGDDPDFDETAEILCYDGAFPFHWSCYEILGVTLAGEQGVAGIHKFSLHRSLSRLSGICASSLTRVNYGAAAPVNDQFWTEGKGLELTAVNPMLPAADLSANVDLVRSLLSGAPPPELTSDLGLRVRSDPFHRLSPELIYQLCNYLPVESVFKWMQASWIVRQTVGSSVSFWRSRIRVDMPWAFEIQHLIENPGDGKLQGAELELQDWQYKWLYTGLDRATDPKPYLRGSLMLLSLANRRRIWHVCTQIKAVYDKNMQMIGSLH